MQYQYFISCKLCNCTEFQTHYLSHFYWRLDTAAFTAHCPLGLATWVSDKSQLKYLGFNQIQWFPALKKPTIAQTPPFVQFKDFFWNTPGCYYLPSVLTITYVLLKEFCKANFFYSLNQFWKPLELVQNFTIFGIANVGGQNVFFCQSFLSQ